MSINTHAPWHQASFECFLNDGLPQLLADHLPLTGYRVEPDDANTCRLLLTLSDVDLNYTAIPQPDNDGLFYINAQPHVVVPLASQEELDIAEIHCIGEQLHDYIQERIGQAPAGLPWNQALARAWLPLDTWINDFVAQVAQPLDDTNWHSRHTHLRRIVVLNRQKVIAPGQMGRVCPFETPEGPNMGRVFTVALGAEIRDGRLLIVDERPQAGLGPNASMIPFLEHSDPNRLLMAVNMMRQALLPAEPEPALVQTGNEPDAPDFWYGRNLLTAFISWDIDTFGDGIVISQSCAQRLNYPYPAESGDKLCNRHGTKGVISRVLPDEQMPHLPDGTPIELVFNVSGLHVRMNFGQVREALMGRIARAEGQPAIVPPFNAPSPQELKKRLLGAELPESGMETLTLGADGPPLKRPSTVGWVYWGRLVHLARRKVRISIGAQEGQTQGELESYALLDVGAYENLAECLNTRAIRRTDADSLAARVAAGAVEQTGPPCPIFVDLAARLQVAGIKTTLSGEKLTFAFEPPSGDTLKLACPLPHPWLPERELNEIGSYQALAQATPLNIYAWLESEQLLAACTALVEANTRLARMLAQQTPERLVRDAHALLESRLKAFFDTLLLPAHLRFRERQVFSARAVITPASGLSLEQVGLADEIAWTLFGPLVTRQLGDAQAVQKRSEQAAQTLDEVMARSWVIINRAPTFNPTALLAFRPLRSPGHVIRLHPLVCGGEWLNADFDGDQVAVMLPITEAAQREAGERLTVAAHLARSPALFSDLLPPPDALWGLANLSMSEQGQDEINQIAGVPVRPHNGFITRVTLAQALQERLERDGIEPTLAALERLTWRGYAVAKRSGASMSPFIGSSLQRPPTPQTDDPELWDAYLESIVEQIMAENDYESVDLGPQLIAVKIRARGLQHLAQVIGVRANATDAHGETVIIRHSYVKGLTPDEMYASTADARSNWAQWWAKWEQLGQGIRERSAPRGFNMLARARRSQRPGIVFARAAAAGEVDPLVDVDSRLLVGLAIK